MISSNMGSLMEMGVKGGMFEFKSALSNSDELPGDATETDKLLGGLLLTDGILPMLPPDG